MNAEQLDGCSDKIEVKRKNLKTTEMELLRNKMFQKQEDSHAMSKTISSSIYSSQKSSTAVAFTKDHKIIADELNNHLLLLVKGLLRLYPN